MKFYARILGAGKGNKKIEWIIPYVRNKSILDIGCAGEGDVAHLKDNWLHAYLAAKADYCLGIDHNEQTVKLIRSMGYDAIVGDAQGFLIARQFDVVVAADILEHLHDLKGFFNSVNKALKSDGILLLTTPNAWFFLRFLRCIIKGDGGDNPDHVTWFSSACIVELLRRYGFEVDDLRFGSSEPLFYRLAFFRPVLFHTSIFVAARKNPSKPK